MSNVPYTFGNESSPIPLSQLDANFAVTPNYANTAGNVINAVQANITALGTLTSLSISGNTAGANFVATGTVRASGNGYFSNVNTGGSVSAYGNVTGANVNTVGVTASGVVLGNIVSATGNVVGGNITTLGQMFAQGTIGATGNIVTQSYFVGNFLGNITGNLSVGGSNTQILFNQNGNVGAAAGLTYNKDSNVLSVLGSISAQGTVSATSAQFTGLVTAPTPIANTANNQVATTAFVGTTLGALGTMARQNAVSVAITGGSIGNAIITLANISNATITNSTIDSVVTPGGWSITPVGNKLYFSFNGNSVASIDNQGNLITTGDITAYGTP